jgi:hypothetical protein
LTARAVNRAKFEMLGRRRVAGEELRAKPQAPRDDAIDQAFRQSEREQVLQRIGVTVYRVFGLLTVSAVFTVSPIRSGGRPSLPLEIIYALSLASAGA